MLLLRTSLLASVSTLEVPLPAVLTAFSLRSFFLHVCYNYDQKSKSTSLGFEPVMPAHFCSKQPVIVLAAHTSQMRVGNQHDLGLLAGGK